MEMSITKKEEKVKKDKSTAKLIKKYNGFRDKEVFRETLKECKRRMRHTPKGRLELQFIN